MGILARRPATTPASAPTPATAPANAPANALPAEGPRPVQFGGIDFGLASSTPTLDTAIAAAGTDPGDSDELAVAKRAMAALEHACTQSLATRFDYELARERLDARTVIALGGRLAVEVGVVEGSHAALAAALEQMWAVPDDLMAKWLYHDIRARDARASIAKSVTPTSVRGAVFADASVNFGPIGAGRSEAMIAVEVDRTVQMIDFANDALAELRADPSPATAARYRAQIAGWASRPLDIAFVAGAIGPEVWALIDPNTRPPIDLGKPLLDRGAPTLLEGAQHDGQVNGWLGDPDLVRMRAMLGDDSREGAESVGAELMALPPSERARLLTRIDEAGDLEALCENLGWAQVRALHEALPTNGDHAIKSRLQSWFIDSPQIVPPGMHRDDMKTDEIERRMAGAMNHDRWGPSVEQEWESHDNSAQTTLGKVPVLGRVANFALDSGTGGFYSGYSAAIAGFSKGELSPREARGQKRHAAIRGAIVTAAGLAGGAGVQRLLGTSATVAGRIGANTAVGAAAAGTGHLAGDVYNQVAGLQDGFSSVGDYVKSMLIGGAFGAGFGAAAEGVRVARGVRARRAAALDAPAPKQLPASTSGATDATAGPAADAVVAPKTEVATPEAAKPGSAADEAPKTPTRQRLDALRESLGSDATRAKFDEIVNTVGEEKALRQFEGMSKGAGGVDGQLAKRVADAAPKVAGAPRGEALTEAREVTKIARQLEADAKPIATTGADAWLKRIRQELDRLGEIESGATEATAVEVQSIKNNLAGVRAEIADAAARGAEQVNVDVKYDHGEKLDIDNVSNGGKTWTEVKNKSPFGDRSSAWTEEVLPKAQKMLVAGREHGVSDLRFSFPKGVTRVVATKLTEMGFKVEGPIVDR